ncbi:LON peptidase substrate-binding domain-containing protein [Vibrio sp. HN007]|uniref:LON peptidase substrate-binding domain-containing protein n=1 Tax=Vibrio iocasae TaxID=3098914 RepID=UPI0035D52502
MPALNLPHTQDGTSLPLKEKVFPLPIVLFPGGRQRIRVVEAKYIDLLATALKLEKKFIIAFDIEGANEPYHWGVCATVVNFNRTENGFLLVDVEAVSLVTLTDCSKNDRGEWEAHAHYAPHWTMINSRVDTGKLSEILDKLFRSYPQISGLYDDTRRDSIEWVCARLIELLPVPVSAKKMLLKPIDFQSVISFLESIVDENYDLSDPNANSARIEN